MENKAQSGKKDKAKQAAADEATAKTENAVKEGEVVDEVKDEVKTDAANVETDDGVDPETMCPEEYIAFLEGKLGTAIAQVAEFKSAATRLRADFDNYRKRNLQIATESKQQGKEIVLEKLLEVLDNYERAKSCITDEKALEGYEMMNKLLVEVLEAFDVHEIDSNGQPFDAKMHNAILRTPAPEESDGKVIAVSKKGYTVGGKVLRVADVVVGHKQ